ncbi:MAG TPA: hypothetical protein VF173_12480 [Thermoanaerobaculia bacterium]|nr:hypothetical protein [Thermoanaerobaculia bacterium]
MTLSKTLFEPGQVSILSEAAAALAESSEDAKLFLDRHVTGDWGEISPADRSANTLALAIGGELLSSYRTSLGVALSVMTDARGSETYIYSDDAAEKEDSEAVPDFESFTTTLGLALGNFLLSTGRPEALGGCLSAIETLASATMRASQLGSEAATPKAGE